MTVTIKQADGTTVALPSTTIGGEEVIHHLALQPFDSLYRDESDVSDVGELEYSATLNSGYVAPTTSEFNWAGGTTDPRYFRVPMTGWDDVAIIIANNTNVILEVKIYIWVHDNTSTNNLQYVYLENLGNGVIGLYTAHEYGIGANSAAKTIGAMQAPCAYLVVELTPQSALPGSDSYFSIGAARK